MILRLVKMTFKPEETASFLTYFNTIKYKIEEMDGMINLKLYHAMNYNQFYIMYCKIIQLQSEDRDDRENEISIQTTNYFQQTILHCENKIVLQLTLTNEKEIDANGKWFQCHMDPNKNHNSNY